MNEDIPPSPPAARQEPHRIEQLGRVRVDEYAWLKDDNWQAVMRDPALLRADVRTHLEAENAYCQTLLASTAALQETLFKEMRGRIKEDDSSVPQPDGRYAYAARFVAGAQHPMFVRTAREGGAEEILLDVEAFSQGKPFLQVASAQHAPDHSAFVYALDEQGSEYHRIHVRDLSTGETLAPPVESAEGGFVISADSQWLYWIFRDENARPSRVYRRPLRGGEDVLLYEEKDRGMFVHLEQTQSRAFILIAVGDHETSEVWLIDARDPSRPPRLVEPRVPGVMYSVEHWDERLMIHTNADEALDFKLMTAPVEACGRDNWSEFLAYEPGRFLVEVLPFKDYLVRLERVDANQRIVITARISGAETLLPIAEEAYALTIDGGFEYDTGTLRYVYQSPTTPRSWFDYDMADGDQVLRKVQSVPSGHDPADYVARRLFAAAPDGETVPITVLMRAGTPLDGSAPLFLYGYGAYGLSMDPAFSVRALSLVDRDWIWAIAHVRGGSEKGRSWFLEGRKEKKTNTFTDFIAVADHLVRSGYGSSGRIVACGGSAGGMLMGAVANMRPDLFCGIIGAVPFVDVLNTMSDASLPLTPAEWPEWGDPLTDEAAYDRIAGYSPYDNVAGKAYPAVLATGGLSDPRVTYWEPAKWAARLRRETTSGRPVLLKINMDAGHQGAAGRFESLKEVALEYAFAIEAARLAGFAGAA